jgi:hypothetical protein
MTLRFRLVILLAVLTLLGTHRTLMGQSVQVDKSTCVLLAENTCEDAGDGWCQAFEDRPTSSCPNPGGSSGPECTFCANPLGAASHICVPQEGNYVCTLSGGDNVACGGADGELIPEKKGVCVRGSTGVASCGCSNPQLTGNNCANGGFNGAECTP